MQKKFATCTWDCKFTFFAAILLGHLACDLLLKCKKCKKLNLLDIVFSTAEFPNMPNGLPWNLDYKPEKGDITGFNIVNNDLKNTNWKDKKSGKTVLKTKSFAFWILQLHFASCKIILHFATTGHLFCNTRTIANSYF